MGRKILILEKDKAIQGELDYQLRYWGYDVLLANDRMEARKMAHAYDPDIIIINVDDPDLLDIQLLNALSVGHPDCCVILISARADCQLAVQAIKHGAFTLLPKPLQYQQLRSVLLAIESEVRSHPRSESAHNKQITGLIGTSASMLEIHSTIRRISTTDVPVLITGESGTGKELAALALHNQSHRSAEPFIVMNAAAIPPSLMESELFGHEKGAFTGAEGRHRGCFELADNGTLFLDEIAEMPTELQAKLLRVLQDQRVRRLGGSQELALNVRILAATNRDTDCAVAEGALRDDLCYAAN